MQAQLRQSQKDVLKKEVLEEITPALDRIASSAGINQSDREMIAAMTADNVTVTSKLNTIMADNARLRATVESMKNSQSPSTTRVKQEEGKTETAINSSGEHCPIQRGKGPMSRYWFFQEKQYCANCKKMTKHQPAYCPELPERKKRKAESLEEIERRKASK